MLLQQISSRISLPNDDPLRRAIKISLAIHVGALVALYLKSVILPGSLLTKDYIPSLRVDLVSLPDQKKTDSMTPSRSAVDLPVIKERVKQKPIVEKGDYSLSKKNHQDRVKSALARIKALEKLNDGEPVKGNRIAKGSSATGEAKESLETTYFDLVLEKVRAEWELPHWLQEQNLSAKVLIHVDRRGMITSHRFIKSSGNEQFDAAVKKALQAATPFPAPPLAIVPDVSQAGILLGFPI